MNGFKTETMKKHYKANRTLRTGVEGRTPEMLKMGISGVDYFESFK